MIGVKLRVVSNSVCAKSEDTGETAEEPTFVSLVAHDTRLALFYMCLLILVSDQTDSFHRNMLCWNTTHKISGY